MFAPFHLRTQSCPCFIFGLRNKAREYARVWILFITFSPGTWYTPYIAFIKFCFVASTILLLLRANNEHFENNLIDRHQPRSRPPSSNLRPFSSKTLAEIILRRRRFCPDTLVIFHLSANSFLLRLTIDAKRERGLSVRSPFCASMFPSIFLPPIPLFIPPLSRSERGHDEGVEKLSPRFHPNVTDLTSRGDAARFPRIIILLSYNSFNSRESKTRESMPDSLPRILAPIVRRALALCYVLNERRHDAPSPMGERRDWHILWTRFNYDSPR